MTERSSVMMVYIYNIAGGYMLRLGPLNDIVCSLEAFIAYLLRGVEKNMIGGNGSCQVQLVNALALRV
jgi:hypothetical protein